MDFELKIEKPNVSRAWISAGTMGLSYFIGVCPLAFAITQASNGAMQAAFYL